MEESKEPHRATSSSDSSEMHDEPTISVDEAITFRREITDEEFFME